MGKPLWKRVISLANQAPYETGIALGYCYVAARMQLAEQAFNSAKQHGNREDKDGKG